VGRERGGKRAMKIAGSVIVGFIGTTTSAACNVEIYDVHAASLQMLCNTTFILHTLSSNKPLLLYAPFLYVLQGTHVQPLFICDLLQHFK
jgi:hypothetical protein